MRMMGWKFRSNGEIWDVNPTEQAVEAYKKLCANDPKFSDVVELVEVEVTEIEKPDICQLCGQPTPDKNHFCQG